jgi:hypothetical protein
MSPRSETAVLYPRHECHNDGEACGRRWYSTRADHLEPKCRIGQPRAARACMSPRQAWPRLRYRIRWLLAGEHWFHRIKHDELRTAAIGLNLRGQLSYLFCNSVQTSGRRHSAEQDTAVSILVLVKFPRTKKGSVRRAAQCRVSRAPMMNLMDRRCRVGAGGDWSDYCGVGSYDAVF